MLLVFDGHFKSSTHLSALFRFARAHKDELGLTFAMVTRRGVEPPEAAAFDRIHVLENWPYDLEAGRLTALPRRAPETAELLNTLSEARDSVAFLGWRVCALAQHAVSARERTALLSDLVVGGALAAPNVAVETLGPELSRVRELLLAVDHVVALDRETHAVLRRAPLGLGASEHETGGQVIGAAPPLTSWPGDQGETYPARLGVPGVFDFDTQQGLEELLPRLAAADLGGAEPSLAFHSDYGYALEAHGERLADAGFELSADGEIETGWGPALALEAGLCLQRAEHRARENYLRGMLTCLLEPSFDGGVRIVEQRGETADLREVLANPADWRAFWERQAQGFKALDDERETAWRRFFSEGVPREAPWLLPFDGPFVERATRPGGPLARRIAGDPAEPAHRLALAEALLAAGGASEAETQIHAAAALAQFAQTPLAAPQLLRDKAMALRVFPSEEAARRWSGVRRLLSDSDLDLAARASEEVRLERRAGGPTARGGDSLIGEAYRLGLEGRRFAGAFTVGLPRVSAAASEALSSQLSLSVDAPVDEASAEVRIDGAPAAAAVAAKDGQAVIQLSPFIAGAEDPPYASVSVALETRSGQPVSGEVIELRRWTPGSLARPGSALGTGKVLSICPLQSDAFCDGLSWVESDGDVIRRWGRQNFRLRFPPAADALERRSALVVEIIAIAAAGGQFPQHIGVVEPRSGQTWRAYMNGRMDSYSRSYAADISDAAALLEAGCELEFQSPIPEQRASPNDPRMISLNIASACVLGYEPDEEARETLRLEVEDDRDALLQGDVLVPESPMLLRPNARLILEGRLDRAEADLYNLRCKLNTMDLAPVEIDIGAQTWRWVGRLTTQRPVWIPAAHIVFKTSDLSAFAVSVDFIEIENPADGLQRFAIERPGEVRGALRFERWSERLYGYWLSDRASFPIDMPEGVNELAIGGPATVSKAVVEGCKVRLFDQDIPVAADFDADGRWMLRSQGPLPSGLGRLTLLAPVRKGDHSVMVDIVRYA